jgi:hypothetical protein
MHIRGEEKMSNDIFDFGFTAVDETELQAVQDAQKAIGDTEVEARTTQEKLDQLYNAITPLLNNLKANPEKEYILWPDRLAKVEAFESHLQKIYSN